jgi:hypothetical protein
MDVSHLCWDFHGVIAEDALIDPGAMEFRASTAGVNAKKPSVLAKPPCADYVPPDSSIGPSSAAQRSRPMRDGSARSGRP